MKIFKLPQLLESSTDGEYCLGFRDLNSHAVYLLYGRMRPNESGRRIAPGRGHEEIVYVVDGRLRVKNTTSSFMVSSGEAFHIRDDEVFFLENPTQREAIYIIAGGHISPHHTEDASTEGGATPPE